jgi:tRNA (guanine37-N1)-methyltransferase
MHSPFKQIFETGIIKQAIKKGKLQIELLNLRDFGIKGVIDDKVYSGNGMALMAKPLIKAIQFAQLTFFKTLPASVIYLSPQGKILTQKLIQHEAQLKNDIIIVCGYYEGVDNRIEQYIDLELSIGDYVLSNGEFAAIILCDSLVRLIPGVIKSTSLESESFNNQLLDYSIFTKPNNL